MLPSIELRTVVLDCRDAHELGAFYSRLLGWPVACEESDWVLLRSPVPGGAGLALHKTRPGSAAPNLAQGISLPEEFAVQFASDA